MPFYPNQRCQRCYQSSGCSTQRPVPEPRQHTEADCPCHRANTCERRQTMPEDPVIAMAYVPWQRWANLSNCAKALQQGTIFADLNKPFSGNGGHCR